MKFRVAKERLLPLLVACERACDRESTLSIVGSVLMRAESGVVAVIGTDLYMFTGGSVEASVDKPGVIAIPAKELIERVTNMPEQPIDFALKEEVVQISCGKRKYKLKGLPADNFPVVADATAKAASIRIKARKLSELIARTTACVSHDQTRPQIAGYCIENIDGQLSFTTTDGHRIVQVRQMVEGMPKIESVIVPMKGMALIKKTIGGGDEDLQLRIGGGHVSVECAGVRVSVKLQEGKFPGYEHMFSDVKNHKRLVVANRTAMIDVVQAVSVASEKGVIGIDVKNATMSVIAKGRDADAEDELQCLSQDGDSVSLLVNEAYLSDMLKSCSDENVKLYFGENLDLIGVEGSDMFGAVCPTRE